MGLTPRHRHRGGAHDAGVVARVTDGAVIMAANRGVSQRLSFENRNRVRDARQNRRLFFVPQIMPNCDNYREIPLMPRAEPRTLLRAMDVS
jgi:hypothetical protein